MKTFALRQHDLLWSVCKKLPEDYEPYGENENRQADCSCGCLFAAWLEDMPGDWLVCQNPRSHRAGLLTFEHQGCLHFVPEPEEDLGGGAIADAFGGTT